MMNTQILDDGNLVRPDTNIAETDIAPVLGLTRTQRILEYFFRLIVVVLGMVLGTWVALIISVIVGWSPLC